MPMHSLMKNGNIGVSFLAGGQNLIPACSYPFRQIYNRQFFEKVKDILGRGKSQGQGSRGLELPDSVILIEGFDDFLSHQFKIFVNGLLGSK
jgi:hypothetical protein